MANTPAIISIFILLVLSILLLMIYPTPGLLAFATIVLPGLILVQAYLILRDPGVTPPKKTFDEGQWYDQQ